MDRRQFFTALGGMSLPLMFSPTVLASKFAPDIAQNRSLKLYHLHTGERLNLEYMYQGKYVPEALSELDHFLRDFRTGEVQKMDRPLLDLLYAMTLKTDYQKPVSIISAYRSPKTNAALAKRSSGVAKKSYHMTGHALDVRFDGHVLANVRQCARSFKAGGVGYYPGDNFLHIDTGHVRSWG